MKIEIRDQSKALRFVIRDETTNVKTAELVIKKRELYNDYDIPVGLDVNSARVIHGVVAMYRESGKLKHKADIISLPAAVYEAIEYCKDSSASEFEIMLISQSLAYGHSAMKRVQRERAFSPTREESDET